MTAVLQIQTSWVLPDIIRAAGQDIKAAYVADSYLYLPDVSQVDADAALAAYDDAASQEAKQWAIVRDQRNAMLDASDWTQMADNGMSAAVRAAWVDYRQALRDITTQTLPVTWPSEPT